MRATTQKAENEEIRDRCQFIDSCLRGDGVIRSYDIEISGDRIYGGLYYTINKLVKKRKLVTRAEIVREAGIEYGVVCKVVRSLMSDGVVLEKNSGISHRVLSPALQAGKGKDHKNRSQI